MALISFGSTWMLTPQSTFVCSFVDTANDVLSTNLQNTSPSNVIGLLSGYAFVRYSPAGLTGNVILAFPHLMMACLSSVWISRGLFGIFLMISSNFLAWM